MIRPRHAALCSLTALLAIGCAGAGESGVGEGNDGPRIALLTSGPVSDAGWYAGAYEGLLLLESTISARVSHQQTATPAEYDEAFISYATSGYDVIFAHGNEYQDAAMRAGEQFPGTTIIVSGGGRYRENVIPLIFEAGEATYLAGMVAAGMSETGIIGMVAGVAIPPVQGAFQAFQAGARAVNPDVRILETYTGDWNDVAAAREAAAAQLGRGADVLIHNVDGGSFGVFQAVRQVVDGGGTAWALGMNRDQNDVAPDVIVGSAVIRIPEAFAETMSMWSAESIGGAPIYVGQRQEIIDFVFNPELMDAVPSDLLAAVNEAREGIRSGSLEIPRLAFVEDEPGQ